MHILNNQQLQQQPHNFNKIMATIKMQTKMYSLSLMIAGAQCHGQVFLWRCIL